MFKFIHTADVHLDSPLNKLDYYEGAPKDEIRQASRRAFENLVQTAVSENVGFVLVAGDLFDGDWKDYNTGLYLVSQTRMLSEAGIPVFIVAGNHDAANKITKTLRLPPHVHLFPSGKATTVAMDKLGVAVHGQSFATPAVKKDLSQSYPDPLPGYFNIGLLHTCATGREGHEPYAPCSLEGLLGKGYDYWALGHVHRREVLSENPPIVFPGNIQGRHVREIGAKGCLLVTIDDRDLPRFEFKPLDVIRWVIAEVEAASANDGYEVVDLTSAELQRLVEAHDGVPLVTRILIKGETPAHSDLMTDRERWTNEIRSTALEAGSGRIWVEKVKFNTRLPVAADHFRKTGGAIAELITLLDEMSTDPELRRELSSELFELAKKIPRDLMDGAEGFRIEDVEWLGDLLEQVRPLLLRRLTQTKVFE